MASHSSATAREQAPHLTKIRYLEKRWPVTGHLFVVNNYSINAHARSKRSRFITLFQAATKSFTNFSFESAHA